MEDKVIRLIHALMRDEGEWSYDSVSDMFQRKLGKGTVTISRIENMGDIGFVLEVAREDGVSVVEESGWRGPEFVLLAGLYNKISRRFMRTDELLDSMLGDLGLEAKAEGSEDGDE